MDSARDVDLLGESVLQVRVSARKLTLAFVDFSSVSILTHFFFQFEYILFELFGGRSSQPFDWFRFGEWEKCQSAPWREVYQEYV